MDKDALKKHFNFLQKVYEEFVLREGEYKHGRNAKIRNSALKHLEIYLMRFENYVVQHPELYLLLTTEVGSDFNRALIWDEFNSIRYFSRDMANALSKIEGLLAD